MTKKERELTQKGYKYVDGYKVPTKAKIKAKELRKNGYYAQVVPSASDAIGYTEYCVFAKKK